MKVLHTADWHIGQFKGPVVDGVNLRSQDTVNCLNYMIKVAEEEKPDIVCVSGDVFHQEQIGPARYSDEMIVATDTITKLAGVAKAVIVMRGTPNHDGGGQFRVLSKMFANTGNVHIVTSPTVLRTPYADIACIPGFDKQEFRSRFPGLSADEENEAWTSYISSMVMGLRAECHKTSILMAHYVICETFNNQGIPSLIDMNGAHFDAITDYPQLAHGDVDKRDITKLSTFLKDMVGVGILIPDEDLEDYVRDVANLPERTLSDDPRNKDEQREAQRRSPEKEGKTSEVEPEENQEIEEAKKRLGR